eukprot:g77.t1
MYLAKTRGLACRAANGRRVRIGAAKFTQAETASTHKGRSSFSTSTITTDKAKMRNVAIIAHVDHGKTTLVDSLLKACGEIEGSGDSNTDRVMDSMDQEKERGITISSKITGMQWGDMRLNIVDTPGHADFGGEVERVLQLVDGVVIVVDASDGPNTQTRYVTSKALERGLDPLIVINKVDRDTADITATENAIFDLFIALDASESQLEAPFVHASARSGWAIDPAAEGAQEAKAGVDMENGSMAPLLDAIVKHLPSPEAKAEAENATASNHPQLLVTMMSHDPYLGRLLTGKIEGCGSFQVGDEVRAVARTGEDKCVGKVTQILAASGTGAQKLDAASDGMIVTIAGMPEETRVSDTLVPKDAKDAKPIDTPPIDPATVAMTFGTNSSPMAGQDGSKLNSSQLEQRLKTEALNNVSISVDTGSSEGSFEVRGRGDLQLGVLIETLRREDFELDISPPRVLDRLNSESGKREEPYEALQIDVQEQHSGLVMEKLNARKGQLVEMTSSDDGRTRLEYIIPARALLGYRVAFQHDTHGTGVLNKTFDHWGPHAGHIEHVRTKGALVSTSGGKTPAYALAALEPRGQLFVKPQSEVYEGMIVGEHSRENDLQVNPCKGKQLTNMRTSGADESVVLTPPRVFTLEEAIGYMKPDELLEVTPGAFRMRKFELDSSVRKQTERKKKRPKGS